MFNSPVWQLIVMSDWISKYIVLLGLFILSIVCVAIIIFKAIKFYEQKKKMVMFLQRASSVHSFDMLKNLGTACSDSLGGQLIIAGLAKLQQLMRHGQPVLSADELERLAFMLEQEVDRLVRQEEQYVPVLGVSAAVSPLIGLFGTVCGLIYAFMCISQEKSADIATVAPGIAAALMTTLAGLVVAIPAMVSFHYFSHELRQQENRLYEVSDLFMMLVRQTFDR